MPGIMVVLTRMVQTVQDTVLRCGAEVDVPVHAATGRFLSFIHRQGRDELTWGLLWAVCIGTRPAGSCQQGHDPRNQVDDRGGTSSEACRPHRVRTTTTTTTSVSLKQVDLCCVSNCGATLAVGLMADGEGTSAMRRRQRRLRSWLRHERQTVAMELAAALHHSRDVGPGTHASLRAQQAASSREEAGVETHNALRGLKTLPPGMRPEQLPEAPGPQRRDRTVRGTSVGSSLLAVQSLRGADGVDNTAAKFLLQQALKMKKEEEEEKERRRKREEAQYEARMLELDRRVFRDEQLTPAESYAWRKWAGHLPSEPRRKKKRKKKKLPSAPRPRHGCRRLCDHQRQVPAVRIPVMMQRQVPTVHSFILPVQLLDTVFDMPVVVLRQLLRSMLQKAVDSPQLQSIVCRRHSLFFRSGSSPWSSLFSRPQRFTCCCSVAGGRCPCYAGLAISPVQVVERTVKIPQSQLVENIVVALGFLTLLLTFPLCSTTGALGLEVQKTAVSQLQFITVVDTPFVAQMLVWTGRSMPLLCRSCSSDFVCSPLYLADTCSVFGVRLWSTGF